jgi:hypothetical protein
MGTLSGYYVPAPGRSFIGPSASFIGYNGLGHLHEKGNAMRSLLQERCEIEFVQYVAGVLDSEPDCLGQASADTPWGVWGFTKAGIPHLIRDIRAAQDAKVWFSEPGPSWGQPLPMGRECAALFRARAVAVFSSARLLWQHGIIRARVS